MQSAIHGFNLIEVLVSLFILSLVLLNFDAMEIFSIRENRNAYFFSVAENQLNSMVERLKAFDKKIDLEKQLAIWNQQNRTVLPQGIGFVKGNQISIFWGKKSNNKNCEKILIGELNCLSIKMSE